MTAKGASDKISAMPRKPTPENIATGKRLERLRLAHGYETHREMAELLHVSEDAWWSWENGINGFPLEHARRLRNRWGVTFDYIYEGAETAMPGPLMEKLRKVA